METPEQARSEEDRIVIRHEDLAESRPPSPLIETSPSSIPAPSDKSDESRSLVPARHPADLSVSDAGLTEDELSAQSAICSICLSPVNQMDDQIVCSECSQPFHADCWQENLGCATYGCSQVNALREGPDIKIDSAATVSSTAPSLIQAGPNDGAGPRFPNNERIICRLDDHNQSSPGVAQLLPPIGWLAAGIVLAWTDHPAWLVGGLVATVIHLVVVARRTTRSGTSSAGPQLTSPSAAPPLQNSDPSRARWPWIHFGAIGILVSWALISYGNWAGIDTRGSILSPLVGLACLAGVLILIYGLGEKYLARRDKPYPNSHTCNWIIGILLAAIFVPLLLTELRIRAIRAPREGSFSGSNPPAVGQPAPPANFEKPLVEHDQAAGDKNATNVSDFDKMIAAYQAQHPAPTAAEAQAKRDEQFGRGIVLSLVVGAIVVVVGRIRLRLNSIAFAERHARLLTCWRDWLRPVVAIAVFVLGAWAIGLLEAGLNAPTASSPDDRDSWNIQGMLMFIPPLSLARYVWDGTWRPFVFGEWSLFGKTRNVRDL